MGRAIITTDAPGCRETVIDRADDGTVTELLGVLMDLSRRRESEVEPEEKEVELEEKEVELEELDMNSLVDGVITANGFSFEECGVEIEVGELIRILLGLQEHLLEPAQIDDEEHPGEHREQAQHPVGDR